MAGRKPELETLSDGLQDLTGEMRSLREEVGDLRRLGSHARDSFRSAELRQTSLGAENAATVRKSARDGFSRFGSSLERTFDRVEARFDRLSGRKK